MTRIFFFILGFIFLTLGLTFLILYLNIVTDEYNFTEYVKYIINKKTVYLVPLGILIINLSLFKKGEKNEIYI